MPHGDLIVCRRPKARYCDNLLNSQFVKYYHRTQALSERRLPEVETRMPHTIRQQYDKMNQSSLKSSLRSNLDEGISPQRNSLTICQLISLLQAA